MSSVKISAATAVSTLSDSYALPIGNVGNSTSNNVTVATLAQYAAKYCSDINVVYNYGSASSTAFRSSSLYRYITSRSSMEPVGLEIVNITRPFIVALTEYDGTMNWASGSMTTGNTYYTPVKKAIFDIDGETNTANAVAKEDDSSYAIGYCNQFSCVHSTYAYGLGAGCWYLPSLGELRIIETKFAAINWALGILTNLGYTTMQLQSADYWSSTEYAASNAWYVNFAAGGCYIYSKVSGSCRVRPVSILQSFTTA